LLWCRDDDNHNNNNNNNDNNKFNKFGAQMADDSHHTPNATIFPAPQQKTNSLFGALLWCTDGR